MKNYSKKVESLAIILNELSQSQKPYLLRQASYASSI